MNKQSVIHVFTILLFIILILIVFRDFMLTGNTYFTRDMGTENHPARIFAAESLIKGEIPLWNQYSSCGIPFMAGMVSAVWYPLSVFFYLFYFVAALKVYYLVHFVLYAFFGYLFGRKCGLSSCGGWIIGVLFALNGYNMTKLEFICNAGAALWLPLMIMFRGYPFFLGMLFSFAFLAGSNQQIIFQLFGVLLFAVLIRRCSLKSCMHIMGGGLCAVLLSSIQFVPSLELYLHSFRFRKGFTQHESSFMAFKLKELIGLILPYEMIMNKYYVLIDGDYWAKGMYVGIGASVLAGFGFLMARMKNKLIFAGVLGVLVIISMGNNLPDVFRFVQAYVPFIKIFRFPALISYLIIFTVILMCVHAAKNMQVKYQLVFFALVAAELLMINNNLLPVVPSGFFYRKGPVISYIQKNLNNSRFILSPIDTSDKGTYKQSSQLLTWHLEYDILRGNVGVPFHLRNAGGFENLESRESVFFTKDLYALDTVEAFMQKAASAKIKYLICAHPMENGFKEIIYPHWANILRNPYEDDTVTLPQRYYPGWKAYYQGAAIPVIKDNEGWIDVSDEYPKKEVVFKYRPFSFTVGLFLTLFGLLCIMVRGIQYISFRF